MARPLHPRRTGRRRWQTQRVALATLLALTAAVLHAWWNLKLKQGVDGDVDRFTLVWGQFVAGGLYGAVLLAVVVAGGWAGGLALALPFALASGVVHIAYARLLAASYDHGDLSLTYPIARGGGALAAGVLGLVLLGDHLSPLGWLGVAVVVAGLVTLIRRPVPARAPTLALVVAATIGLYTVADASGARRVDVALAYVALNAVSAALALTVYGVATGRLPGLVHAGSCHGARLLGSGAALVVTYGLVLVAMRHAPVGYVAALRESSVVIAAVVGWRVLGEPMSRGRLLSAVAVVAGLVLLVTAS